MSLFDLSGKVAIVTGASYGIGFTFAETLLRAGAKVVLAARGVEKLNSAAQTLSAAGGDVLPVVCDVGDAAQVQSLVETSIGKWGRVDIVVNNAGIAAEAGVMPENVPHDLFEQTVRTNLFGLWYVCRSAGSAMLKDGKGGSIINIASVSGIAGLRDNPPAYQASKAAVINLTRSLACSWADRGVRVNAIAPGFIETERVAAFTALGSLRQDIIDATPMRRWGKPGDLRGGLLFLASEASSFVTGQTLSIDGGWSAGSGQFSFGEATYRALEELMPAGLGKRILNGGE